jgi:hypothetical protein
VIDDVDNLCRDPAMVRLLKALCDSQETRRVCWLTASSSLGDGEDDDKPPREFETRSRLIIIANDWKTLNKHIAAVNDRGHVIQFEPSAESIHAEVACWFKDGEIYDCIGRHLGLIGRRHSMRWYVQATEWRRAGLDWRDLLIRSWDFDLDHALALRLLEDATLTMQERAKRFSTAAVGGKSERRFYYIYKRLRLAGVIQKPLQFCSDQTHSTAKLQPIPACPPPCRSSQGIS